MRNADIEEIVDTFCEGITGDKKNKTSLDEQEQVIKLEIITCHSELDVMTKRLMQASVSDGHNGNTNHIVLYKCGHWALFDGKFDIIRGKQGRCQKNVITVFFMSSFHRQKALALKIPLQFCIIVSNHLL